MLSGSMLAELEYFLAMLFYGMGVSAGYHLLLYLRAVLPHAKAVVDAEDILYLMAAGVAFFLVAYEKNDGILRWYAFAGAGLGIMLYTRTAGVALEAVRKWIMQKLLLQKRKKTAKIKAQSDYEGTE